MTYSRSFRLITGAVLVSFAQTLFPTVVLARPKHSPESVASAPTENLVESAPPAPPSSIEPRKISKQTLTLPIAAVFEVYSASLSITELREVSITFRRELKNTGKFLVYSASEMRKALSKTLNDEIVAAKQINQFVEDAKKLYDEFKFSSAAVVMREAMKTITAFDATPTVIQQMSEAYLIQALILDAQQNPKEAEVAFLNSAALNPKRQLDPALYPPSVIAKFYQAKESVPKIKNGTLRIESNPPAAEVFVDDKKQGTTPLTLKSLPLGAQKIRISKNGFEPTERNVMVVSTGANDYSNQIEVNLNQSASDVSLDALMGEIVSRKTLELQLSKMADVGKLLYADTVFAARIEKSSKNFDLYLVQIDSKSGQVLAKSHQTVANDLADYDVSLIKGIQELIARKTTDEFTDRIAVEPRGGKYLASYNQKKPFYKKWPFYVVLGVVAAAGGGSAAYLLTRSSGPASNIGGSGGNQP